MVKFAGFTTLMPIEEYSIEQFAQQVPPEVLSAWRENGMGFFSDGYFRMVDPRRAAEQLEGVVGLPDGSTVLFASALGDLIVHAGGRFLVIKFRWGVIDVAPNGTTFEDIVALLEDPAARQVSFEWAPYPEAVERTGIPHLEELLGFVPLLGLGGAPVAANLQRMDFWEHIPLIAQTVGLPQLRGFLRTPDGERPVPSATAVERSSLSAELEELAGVGEGLFRNLAEKAGQSFEDELTFIPFDDGVAVVRAVRGGGTIFVGADRELLYQGSAVGFEDGVRAFRAGTRTALERF